MSHWDKYFNTPIEDDDADATEPMRVLKRQGVLLQLECPRDGCRFWFDTVDSGNNSVMRQDVTGTEEIHAKCPECGGEWNGNASHYYAVGWMEVGSEISGRKITGFRFGIEKVAEATSPLAAIDKANLTNPPPDMSGNYGVMVVPCSRKLYDRFLEENLHQPSEEVDIIAG